MKFTVGTVNRIVIRNITGFFNKSKHGIYNKQTWHLHGTNIEPYGTSFTRLYQELHEKPIFVHHAQFSR